MYDKIELSYIDLSADTAIRLLKEIESIETLVDGSNYETVSFFARHTIAEKYQENIKNSVGELGNAIVSGRNMFETLSRTQKYISKQSNNIDEILKTIRFPIVLYSRWPSMHDVKSAAIRDFFPTIAAMPSDPFRDSPTSRILHLQRVFALACQPFESIPTEHLDAMSAEMLQIHDLLKFIASQHTGHEAYSIDFCKIPNRYEATEFNDIEKSFGLKLDTSAGSFTDIRSFSNDLISNWTVFQEVAAHDREEIKGLFNQIDGIENSTPFRLENTDFHENLGRSRYIISNQLLDPTANAPRFLSGPKCIVEIKNRLEQLTGIDTHFAAHVVSWLHQRSFGIFTDPSTQGVNVEKWREFHQIEGYDGRPVFPAAPTPDTQRPTYVIDPWPNGELRIEFRFQSRQAVAQTVSADGGSLETVDLAKGDNFWSGRYAVILSPSGTARLDGAFETHSNWAKTFAAIDVDGPI